MIQAPAAGDEYVDWVEVGYRWGLGGSLMVPFGKRFAVAPGLQLRHSPLTLDDNVLSSCAPASLECRARAHLLTVSAPVRVGLSAGPAFLYGLVAPGMAIGRGTLQISHPALDRHLDDTDLGFNLGVGLGAQILVWKGFSIGAEVGMDLNWLRSTGRNVQGDLASFAGMDSESIIPDGLKAHALTVGLVVAWWF